MAPVCWLPQGERLVDLQIVRIDRSPAGADSFHARTPAVASTAVRISRVAASGWGTYDACDAGTS